MCSNGRNSATFASLPIPMAAGLAQALLSTSAIESLRSYGWMPSPEDGQRPIDFTSEFIRKVVQNSIEKGEPGFPPLKAELFLVNENDRAYVDSKLTPHPVGTYLQPIKLSGARDKVAKKTYIRATRFQSLPLTRRWRSARPIRRGALWKTPPRATSLCSMRRVGWPTCCRRPLEIGMVKLQLRVRLGLAGGSTSRQLHPTRRHRKGNT
jgi:hypothetical protein